MDRVAEVREGTLLAGRYRITAHLGAGGMAQVWSGTDEVLDRPVAIKLMDAKLLAAPSFRSRFRGEARAAARLSHPRIVAVHDYGEAHLPGGAVLPYIVMDLLTGQTLAQRLRAGPMTWREAARVCREVGEALCAAHEQGVVHRDIKPANIFLTPVGVRVLDFGIAEAVAGGGTGGDNMAGTPGYLAPDLESTPATDIYALGLVLAEALSLPDAPAAPDAPTGPPPELERLCLRCVAPDPALRPTAAQFTAALAVVLGEARGSAVAGAQMPVGETGGPPGTGVGSFGRDGGSGLVAGSGRWPGRPAGGAGARDGLTRVLTGSAEPGGLAGAGAPAGAGAGDGAGAGAVAGVAGAAPAAGAAGPGERAAAAGQYAMSSLPSLLGRVFVTGRGSPDGGPGRIQVRPALAVIAALALAGVVAGLVLTAGNGPPGAGRHPAGPRASGQPAPPQGQPTAGPVSPAAATATLTLARQQVHDGLTQGQVRSDVATDLNNVITNLLTSLAQGQPADLAQRIADIRAKVATRLREGAISAALAQTLETELGRAAAAPQ